MKTKHASSHALLPRKRSLAACLAAICAAGVSGAAISNPIPEALAGTLPMPAAAFVRSTPATALRGAAVAAVAVDSPLAPASLVVTNCDDSGPGSLRDTIPGAASGDTIDLTQLGCSTISLSTGAIIIGQDQLALIGPGSSNLTIDAAGSPGYAALYHPGGGSLIVQGMTIANGSKYRSDHDARGGCIHSDGNVLLRDSRVVNCRVKSASSHAALGGGVFAQGEVYMLRSTVSGSAALALGYGYASGGGVYALDGFQSAYSTIDSNVALGYSATPSFGGGVFARGFALIIGTTVSGNHSVRMGGLALADNSGSPATLINSTVSGNTADTQTGGVFARPPLNLYNSTIAFNVSGQWSDGAGHYFAAGVDIRSSGEMDSTIIANNTVAGSPFPTADLSGTPATGFNGGHNNVMFCGAACPTDTTHEDPGLHPLQDNGGLTRTHVPTPGQWDTFGGTNVVNLQWDQRGPGFPRQSSGDWPEIGALQINSDIIFANGFN